MGELIRDPNFGNLICFVAIPLLLAVLIVIVFKPGKNKVDKLSLD